MLYFFPLKEKTLSSSSAAFSPESAPKSGYTSWKAHSTSIPGFGTRLAKGGVWTQDPSWLALHPSKPLSGR